MCGFFTKNNLYTRFNFEKLPDTFHIYYSNAKPQLENFIIKIYTRRPSSKIINRHRNSRCKKVDLVFFLYSTVPEIDQCICLNSILVKAVGITENSN